MCSVCFTATHHQYLATNRFQESHRCRKNHIEDTFCARRGLRGVERRLSFRRCKARSFNPHLTCVHIAFLLFFFNRAECGRVVRSRSQRLLPSTLYTLPPRHPSASAWPSPTQGCPSHHISPQNPIPSAVTDRAVCYPLHNGLAPSAVLPGSNRAP